MWGQCNYFHGNELGNKNLGRASNRNESMRRFEIPILDVYKKEKGVRLYFSLSGFIINFLKVFCNYTV